MTGRCSDRAPHSQAGHGARRCSPVRFAKLVGVLALASCGVRATEPIDVAALVAKRGPVEARRDLEIRIISEPRDVQARLAAATLDGDLHRDGDAIDDYEAIEALGGPLGPRWHAEDRARFAALLVHRGEARMARGSGHGVDDLEQATRLGASVPAATLGRARAVAALAKLRHIDAEVRAQGREILVGLGGNPAWAGADAKASAEQHARFGVWLWERGAKREAYEQLARWHDSGAHDPTYDLAFAVALAWWSPDAAVAALTASAPPRPTAAPARPLVVGDDPRAAAAAHYARARLEAIVGAGEVGAGPPTLAPELTTDLPGEPELLVVARAFRRDPTIAARLGRELVGRSIDRAVGQAAVGALFDALGDPARARTMWLGASEDSDDAAIVTDYACAVARTSDGDAALVAGASAAAASGDPAVTWLQIGHALMRGGRALDVITAMRSAIDLAGANALAEALELAIEASRRVGRDAQADRLAAQRAQLLPPPVDPVERVEVGRLARHDPDASMLAAAWVATRADPGDIALRAALVVALERDDVRRQTIIDELVARAGDRDPERALTAVLALP
jgi:hypothetical protein